MMSKPISPLLPKKSQTTQAIIAPVALTEQQTKTIQNAQQLIELMDSKSVNNQALINAVIDLISALKVQNSTPVQLLFMVLDNLKAIQEHSIEIVDLLDTVLAGTCAPDDAS